MLYVHYVAINGNAIAIDIMWKPNTHRHILALFFPILSFSFLLYFFPTSCLFIYHFPILHHIFLITLPSSIQDSSMFSSFLFFSLFFIHFILPFYILQFSLFHCVFSITSIEDPIFVYFFFFEGCILNFFNKPWTCSKLVEILVLGWRLWHAISGRGRPFIATNLATSNVQSPSLVATHHWASIDGHMDPPVATWCH